MFASAPFIAAGLLLSSTLTLAVPRPAADSALDTGSRFTPSNYDKPNAGPPLAWFRGDESLPISALATAATKGKKSLNSYQINAGTSTKSTVYGDWANLSGVSAYFWTADMDIDCDGKDFKCKGNTDGQSETNFGALAAYEVPWAVIPDSFRAAHSSKLTGNNIMAIICDGKLIYAVFGDSNGATPEVIGEGSWLLGQRCFPNGDINGNNGHGETDVTYIVFDKVLPSSAINDKYITNFSTLKTMGDELVGKLVTQLKL